ncbi:MAG: PAS domain S-box protein, partial [Deltaproteobacteria bacterium]|nr:PAS domain S-box protein [Deltaproteobacteria bacterium]
MMKDSLSDYFRCWWRGSPLMNMVSILIGILIFLGALYFKNFLVHYGDHQDLVSKTYPYGIDLIPFVGVLVALLMFVVLQLYQRSRLRGQRLSVANTSLLKMSLAIEQSPTVIVITNTQGDIEFVNPKFTELTGYTPEEAIGKNPRVLHTDQTPPETIQDRWKPLTAGKIWEGKFVNKKKNGELFIEVAKISPVRNPEGVVTHYIAIKENITEKRKVEKELAESQTQLFQTAKLATLGEMSTGMAHEMNQPMAGISLAVTT